MGEIQRKTFPGFVILCIVVLALVCPNCSLQTSFCCCYAINAVLYLYICFSVINQTCHSITVIFPFFLSATSFHSSWPLSLSLPFFSGLYFYNIIFFVLVYFQVWYLFLFLFVGWQVRFSCLVQESCDPINACIIQLMCLFLLSIVF